MKKKYQVFISSTYKDLVEERAAVSQCLLEMGCIPVGMEQFPSSNMEQMDYIKMMLDDCDYYVLILAGKYGTLASDGIGYTEKEYDYAVSKNIPVMSFLVSDLGKLEANKCESKSKNKKLLEAFRKKVSKNKLVKFYTSIESLQANVAISLHQCMIDYPAVGWVRGNHADLDESIEKKIEKYMEEHTISNEEIDAMFAKSEPVVRFGDNDAGGVTATISSKRYMDETQVENLLKRI